MWRVLGWFCVALALPGRAAAEDLTSCETGQGAHEAGRYDQAVDDYTRCIEEGDLTQYNLAAVYFNRANAYSDLGELDLAIQDYDEAIRLDPEGAGLFLNRGLVYATKADYERAVSNFDKAIELYPNFGLAFQNRCMAMTLLDRLEQALEDCNESLRLQPENPMAFDSRARTFWLMGREDEARGDLEAARALDPGFPLWQDRFQAYETLFR